MRLLGQDLERWLAGAQGRHWLEPISGDVLSCTGTCACWPHSLKAVFNMNSPGPNGSGPTSGKSARNRIPDYESTRLFMERALTSYF